jgi:hypothetical protein
MIAVVYLFALVGFLSAVGVTGMFLTAWWQTRDSA